MKIFIDTHLHIYPYYDLAKALHSLALNAKSQFRPDLACGVLTERADCVVFDSMQTLEGWQCNRAADESSVTFSSSTFGKVVIFPGIQVATRERIEVLGLFMRERIEDGVPAKEAIDRILLASGVPVICWSPGKWFFSRGELVNALIGEYGNRIMLGDTYLRPPFWPYPRLFSYGESFGIKILGGTDPLPIREAGEEGLFGIYGTLIEGEITDELSATVRGLLTSQPVTLSGRRGSTVSFLKRWFSL